MEEAEAVAAEEAVAEAAVAVFHAAVRQQAAASRRGNLVARLHHARHRGRKPGSNNLATVMRAVKIASNTGMIPVKIARITGTMPARTVRTSLMTSGMITTIIIMVAQP